MTDTHLALAILFTALWIAGFIGTFRQIWVQRSEPWYGKLFAYMLMFFAWPFVLLFKDRG